MANLPLSEVTIIAAALGIFFLLVAFYKSIFHKRKPQKHLAANPTFTPTSGRDDVPIKLSDPFQQIPAKDDPAPIPAPARSKDTPFYPSLPKQEAPSISAFHQFKPNKDFNSPQKSDATYEWE